MESMEILVFFLAILARGVLCPLSAEDGPSPRKAPLDHCPVCPPFAVRFAPSWWGWSGGRPFVSGSKGRSRCAGSLVRGSMRRILGGT